MKPEIAKEVFEYLKNNLRIDVDKRYPYDSDGHGYIVVSISLRNPETDKFECITSGEE